MQITIGEIKKSAVGENFRNTNCFYTKNSAKMQKNGQQKIHPTHPPGGGTENVFILGIPPGRGGITENSPPPRGDLPPPVHSLN